MIDPRVGRFQSLSAGKIFRKAFIPVFITGMVAMAFAPIGRGEFLLLDDPDYVSANPQVRRGLDFESVRWAFTTFHAANWHPLTWISHQFDVTVFGMNPAAHHLIGVALHAATACLLFLMLNRLTGSVRRSLAVCLLFAIHPLRVESVAWVSERKDVLCGLFWMLTLMAYIAWVRHRGIVHYVVIAVTLTFALLSKPMAVTLPCVMLLLDSWPLGRFRNESWLSLILEKGPLFLLAAISSVITVFAQSSRDAIGTIEDHALSLRGINAFVSTAAYLRDTLWPSGLLPFYPYPKSIPAWQSFLSILILVVISVGVWLSRRRGFPLVGWFWYLGTLVPTIGIIQTGDQSRADRYTYIPQIGVFLLAVWGSYDLLWLRLPRFRTVLIVVWMAAILASAMATNRLTGYWRRNITLFKRVLRHDPENWLALYQMGIELGRMGRTTEAKNYMEAAFSRRPFLLADLHFRSAEKLLSIGNLSAMMVQLDETLRINPRHKRAKDLREWVARAYPNNGKRKK